MAMSEAEKRKVREIILLYCMEECTKNKNSRAAMLSGYIQEHGPLSDEAAAKAQALLE